MSYEINVSLYGKHLFATHERSLQTQEQTQNVLAVFLNKFPSKEGFVVNLSHLPGIHYGYSNIEAQLEKESIGSIFDNIHQMK